MEDFREIFKYEHAIWSAKLADYFDVADGSFTVEEASNDDGCPLGEWLLKNTPLYNSMPEFIEVGRLHKRYHELSANVVKRLNDGEKPDKASTIGKNSEFSKTALDLATSLLMLKRKTG